jgi:4-amino-4-deoxy-L-arabinose transferase-like glycosyltransferase
VSATVGRIADVELTASATATDAVPERGAHSPRGLWAEYWPLLALGLVAILVSVVVHHWIYPAYSWNRDEPVYLWQVKALRAGVILPTDGGAPAFFQPWLSGHQAGHFFSQYTLGWPIVLLIGELVFGTAASALAFGTLLAVLGTYAFARTVTSNHGVALTAAAFMLLSPMLAIQSGVYLGYLFTLGLGLLFGAAVITGFERRRPLLLVAAGALVGWIFMTRPFDAVLWAAAFGAYLVVVHRHEWGRLFRASAWTALGALPLVIATLAYNRKVTGSFTEFPITAADPLDTFGFGLRRLMPTFGKDDYTVGSAIRSTGRNGVFLPLFLFGSYLGVVVAAFGLWLRRRERTTLAMLLLMVAFPLGYFFFWGMHVSAATSTLSGPIYFMPLFAPLVVFIATVVQHGWRRRRAVGAGIVAALVVVTIPFAVNRIDVNRRISEAQVPWRDGTEQVKGRSVVFIQQSGAYLLFLNPFSSNTADLDGRILYATDQGPANLDLIASERRRTPYLQKTSVPPRLGVPNDHPVTPRVTVQKLRVLRTGVVTLHVRVTNPGRSPLVVLTLQVGDHVEQRTLATDSTAGASYDVQWTLAAPGVTATSPAAITLPARLGSIVATTGYGATVEAASKPSVRQVISYRIDGAVAELLLPSQPAKVGTVNDAPGWIEVDSLPQLRVEATRSISGP